MKYIVINFRDGEKIKIPANLLKSIDVPDDFTVNKEGENTNKRVCIANGCYVDSLDKTISLEQQLLDKKCYTSDDFSNNELVNNGIYGFLEEILNSYTHDLKLGGFSTDNGTITDNFIYEEEVVVEEEVELIPIAYKSVSEEDEEESEEDEEQEVVAYVNANTEELDIGIEVYIDENGNTPAPNGDYYLYQNISVEVPNGVHGFTVNNGQISELIAEEEE